MSNKILLKKGLAGLVAVSLIGSPAFATTQTVNGHVVSTQGHLSPACRTAAVREDSTGTVYYFRLALPTTGPDTIEAVLLTAIASQLPVSVVFDPAVTTGCGAEPAIQYVGIASS